MAQQTELEWLPPYSWCPKIIGGGRGGYDCPMPVADGLYINADAHPYLSHIVGSVCRTLAPAVLPHFTQLLTQHHKMLGLPPDVGQRWEYAQRIGQIMALMPNYGLAKQLRRDSPPRFVRFDILNAVQRYVDRKVPPPEGQTPDEQAIDPTGPQRLRAALLPQGRK